MADYAKDVLAETAWDKAHVNDDRSGSWRSTRTRGVLPRPTSRNAGPARRK